MIRSLALVAALAVFTFAALAVVAPAEADAAPKWTATATSTDAGTSQNVDATGGVQNTTLILQSQTQFCYKTSSSTGIVADCTKDEIVYPASVVLNANYVPPKMVKMGQDRYIAARNPDGGDVSVKVLRECCAP